MCGKLARCGDSRTPSWKVANMARKVLNRKELREESDAAERAGKTKKKAAEKRC